MGITYRGTTAVITGASGGIGEEFARQLAARGANLVLVARRIDKLSALADELAATHGIIATPIEFDLFEPDVAPRLRAELTQRGLSIDTLINNAGTGFHGLFLDTTPERIEQIVKLNILATAQLSREFLPDLIDAGRGALVNVASTTGYQSLPGMAVHAAGKAFILHFTEAVGYEVRKTPLVVLALSPGATKTDFFATAGDIHGSLTRLTTPQEVVAACLKALDRRKPPPSVVPGFGNAFLAHTISWLPRRLQLIAGGKVTGA